MSKKLLLVVCAVSLALAGTAVAIGAVTAGNTGWRWSNPLPQGSDLKTLETVGSRGYAGGASGTLLRTDDAGATWSSIRTGLLDDITLVRAITTDSIVFAGSCALRRSDDGGKTIRRLLWTPNDEDCSPKISSFHFPDTNNGYLLLENGEVLSTADGGESWTKRSAIPNTLVKGGDAVAKDIWFTAAGAGVAAARAGNGLAMIYRTTDFGASWTQPAQPGLFDFNRFEFVNANFGLGVGTISGAVVTNDGGASWSIAIGPGGGPTIPAGSVDCANSNKCVAAASDGGMIFVTNDGGNSWTSVSPSSKPVLGVGMPSASRILGVGGSGTTVASDDDGATWNSISRGPDGEYTRVRATSATSALAWGANGALARTTDGGASWNGVNTASSRAIVAAAFPTAERGYAIDNSGALMRTSNGGAGWQFFDTGGVQARDLAAPAENTVLLVGPKGVRRSTDGGQTIARLRNKDLMRTAVSRLDHAGKALVVSGSGMKSIWISTDGGARFKRFPGPRIKQTIRGLDLVSTRAGYVLDSKGELWATRNAGRKWVRIETTGATNSQFVAFGDVAHGYLTDSTGRVLYTADAGRTWTRQYPVFSPIGQAQIQVSAFSKLGAFGLILGTSKIFVTESGGMVGSPSVLTIKSSAKRVARGATITVRGTLSPANGGEIVAVVARPLGAKRGTAWTAQSATVASNGTFTTRWKVRRPTIFVARWSGNTTHDGDAAKAVIVKLK